MLDLELGEGEHYSQHLQQAPNVRRAKIWFTARPLPGLARRAALAPVAALKCSARVAPAGALKCSAHALAQTFF